MEDTYQAAAPLTEAEELALAARVRSGDRDAEATMVESVVDLVRWLAARHGCAGVDLDDMVQEGLLAAVEASRTYDPSKGRWPAWAALHAKSAMLDLASRRRIVPIPDGQRRMARRYRETRDALREEHGFEPTSEEVRRAMGVSQEKFDNAVAAAEGPAARPVGTEVAASLAPAREERDEEEALADAQADSAIRCALRRILSPREAAIFEMKALDGLATWKVAERLNANHGGIKAAMVRAVGKLREALASAG